MRIVGYWEIHVFKYVGIRIRLSANIEALEYADI